MYVLRPACVLFLALVAACTANKSENPLSPTVAGPIEGVTITAPKVVHPAVGARLARGGDPITLTVENASSNSPRPLTYVYEGSLDAVFSSEVFRQENVAPGTGGTTSLRVTSPLAAGQTYYWRARATDGVNVSAYSDTAHFTVFEPFVLSAPTPTAPGGGTVVASLQPTLRAENAARSGPPEPVFYAFEVASTPAFSSTVAAATVPEQTDHTDLTVSPLDANSTYYWRVRATSASATSPWSTVLQFITPAAATAPPPGPLPPSNPGARPSPREGEAMVAAVIADLRARGISMNGDCGGFEITKRVAWAFRNRGAGLERKPAGRNCQGHSIDIVIFTDGQTVDMLIGAGADNGPTWQEHGVLSDWRDWWIAPTNPD